MANPEWLSKNLKITFSDLDFCDDRRTQTPHDAILDDVHAIGKTSYDTYEAGIYLESRLKPWRSSMKARAKYMAECAARCLDTHQRESAWRMKLEHELTSRFDHEVNCTICRAELWRAPKDPTIATSFKTPQRRCQCSLSDRFDNIDAGLSRIFDCHIEEPIEHHESIPTTKEVGRRSAPDRVYGLRKTERLRRLLEETLMPSGDLIGDKLKSTPYNDRSHPLAFPFLILESKSEKSSDSRSDAQSQTAPALITCLEIQARLTNAVRAVSPEHPSLQQHPLTWFLCHKGEQWYVAIAFFHNKSRSPQRYCVQTMWSGKINLREEALQLLLIMDYIFDWARDVYRKNIIDQLLALAADTTTTLAADTDLMTVVGHQHRDVSPSFHGGTRNGEAPIGTGLEVFQMLEIFDADLPTQTCIRDARFLTHQVVGIDITKDNLEEYFRSLSRNEGRYKGHARKLSRALRMEHTWLVSAGTLYAIEHLWTGKDREHQDFRGHDHRFLVSFMITSHIARVDALVNRDTDHESRWQQYHTLSFVAASEDVVKIIDEKAALRVEKPVTFEKVLMEKSVALSLVGKIRMASVRHCLSSAIASIQIRSSYDRTVWWNENLPEVTDTPRPISDYACFEVTSRGHIANGLPHTVYKSLKVGRTEPDASFLSTSSLWHEQKPEGEAHVDWCDHSRLISDSEKVVFACAVDGTNPKYVPMQGYTQCIFLLDPTALSSEQRRTPTSQLHPTGCVRLIHIRQRLPPLVEARGKVYHPPHPDGPPKTQWPTDPKPSGPMLHDFDWFVKRTGIRWTYMNTLVRRFENGSWVFEFDPLVEHIRLLKGYDVGPHDLLKPFIAIGNSYGLESILSHLRTFTSDNVLTEHHDSGGSESTTNSRATVETRRIPYPESIKRIIVIDDDDDDGGHPGPSKRLQMTKQPDDVDDFGAGSTSSRSYITIDDEDEDT